MKNSHFLLLCTSLPIMAHTEEQYLEIRILSSLCPHLVITLDAKHIRAEEGGSATGSNTQGSRPHGQTINTDTCMMVGRQLLGLSAGKYFALPKLPSVIRTMMMNVALGKERRGGRGERTGEQI